MGPRRTILHRLASAITIHPAFDGRPRTLEPGSDLGNRDVVVNDELSNPQTSAWSQSCVSVGHKRAFLAVDIFASPTQPARPSPTSHARITILQPTSPVSTPGPDQREAHRPVRSSHPAQSDVEAELHHHVPQPIGIIRDLKVRARRDLALRPRWPTRTLPLSIGRALRRRPDGGLHTGVDRSPDLPCPLAHGAQGERPPTVPAGPGHRWRTLQDRIQEGVA